MNEKQENVQWGAVHQLGKIRKILTKACWSPEQPHLILVEVKLDFLPNFFLHYTFSCFLFTSLFKRYLTKCDKFHTTSNANIPLKDHFIPIHLEKTNVLLLVKCIYLNMLTLHKKHPRDNE